MASHAPRRMTLPEFLEWDDGTDRRYQLIEGVPSMMAPSLEVHGELAASCAREIGIRLKSPCRVINEAGITLADRSDTFYVADLAVTCAPREPGRRMVVEPVLVVEVLSPSTTGFDRLRKVADYRTVSSVQDILIVFSDERRVEIQRRTASGWIVEDLIGPAEITLACCTSPVSLDAIYRDLLEADGVT